MSNGIFWLHIKKSAGTSLRQALGGLYTCTERFKMPSCFIQRPREEWNDILNTYTTPLGPYQFRRSEFARLYLYPDTWDSMFRVAFSRNPYDRVVSMYYHLIWPKRMTARGRVMANLRLFSRDPRCLVSSRKCFDVFLDMLDKQDSCRQQSIFEPYGLLFSTHTNPMVNDIKDLGGALNIPNIYRMESMRKGVAACYEASGVSDYSPVEVPHTNKSNKRFGFSLTKQQKKRVEHLYSEDFDIYENAR
ncbi:sulfotransferase family 2 domain-containing protein [Halorhodospira halophila]|uniref:sulfotransferase family 2 domain-containing protein n=1 Tax=Halorhodospira halophila TaxID=1053 RepID=UPI00191182A0